MVKNPQEASDDMITTDQSSARLPVTEIQRFCMHDGPGVRTVVLERKIEYIGSSEP